MATMQGLVEPMLRWKNQAFQLPCIIPKNGQAKTPAPSQISNGGPLTVVCILLSSSYEPGNPINGLVFNPHNTKHGPGGSSSGEAAIVAYGASILGIGSDIGGSIRVPAHFCGICGIKPTVQRMRLASSLPLLLTLGTGGRGAVADQPPKCYVG